MIEDGPLDLPRQLSRLQIEEMEGVMRMDDIRGTRMPDDGGQIRGPDIAKKDLPTQWPDDDTVRGSYGLAKLSRPDLNLVSKQNLRLGDLVHHLSNPAGEGTRGVAVHHMHNFHTINSRWLLSIPQKKQYIIFICNLGNSIDA
jgi:hypothetical protein